MGLRPLAARWFEALAARDELSRLAEALARSGVVEIEIEHETGELNKSPELTPLLDEYDRLARRYCRYWPHELRPLAGMPGSPVNIAMRALEHLRAWSAEAEPVVTELESVEHDRAELELLHELFEVGAGELPDPYLLSSAGPTLNVRLYAVAKQQSRRLRLPDGVLARLVPSRERVFVIVVGRASSHAQTERVLLAAKARPIELPAWLTTPAAEVMDRIERRSLALNDRRSAIFRELERLAEAHELSGSLADLERLRWFALNLPRLPETRHFALVTGWTSDRSGARVKRAIEQSGVQALLRFPAPPANRAPPVVLSNSPWIKPFESFGRLLGTPAQHEPDPSVLLSVIAPLLFGYMFGDVGQGLILIAIGFALRRRFPELRLLILGGVSAVGFGLLFGSVFSLELWPPLWVHPLSEPLLVLGVSLLGGAVILLLGLALAGLAAFWRHELGRWLRTDAALLVLYLSLLGLFASAWSGLGALLAVLWFAVGSATVVRERRLRAALGALGHLLERTLELVINTISFARVGAFALAHAGLSAAIAGLSEAVVHPLAALAVLVVGNVFSVALEGLAVSIQTTRLVLFEFFVRFLRAEGRLFRPLHPPSAPGQAGALQGVGQS